MLMAHRVLIKDQNEAIQMCQYGCLNFDSFFFFNYNKLLKKKKRLPSIQGVYKERNNLNISNYIAPTNLEQNNSRIVVML